MTRVLAGDIGGTKTILRLVDGSDRNYQVIREKTYLSQFFPHLVPMVEEFLLDLEGSPPQSACFAIAGPVQNNCSQLTNLSWQLNAGVLSQDLSIPYVSLINDFAAVGYGIIHLEAEDLEILQDRPVKHHAPIAVIGAGTGLGQALLFWTDAGYEVVSIEGGHADFAPRTDLEIGLLKYLRDRHGRVSVERVVSGLGIAAIYEYLRDTGVHSESETVRSRMDQELQKGAIIAEYGLSDQDPLCTHTLEMFISAYGAEAGNLALKSLPFGGLYLAGGIAAKLGKKMREPDFLNSFLDKGRMRTLLENIPISMILNPKVGLMGAVYCAQRGLQSSRVIQG